MTVAIDRRSVLKAVASAGAASVAGAVPVRASTRAVAPPDAVGLLYDATLCIGCKTCVVACHEANFDDPWAEEQGKLHFDPVDLDARTRNIIKLYRDDDRWSYVKRQCMHCVDPACAGACMIGALQKREHGIITYNASRCIGCRYCEVACPFNIPRFEWNKPASGRIVKCEMCSHRLEEGKIPACCEVCPTSAVIYGRYADLLEEAHRRIAAEPDRYQDHVYGEHEAGGTQVLYLTSQDVSFADMGLPDLGDEPVPDRPRTIQHGIYQGFIAPAALYAVLAAVIWRNRKHETPTEAAGTDEEVRR
jgi:Fe-S-cluster-containing dehydrogenase component